MQGKIMFDKHLLMGLSAPFRLHNNNKIYVVLKVNHLFDLHDALGILQ